MNRHDELGIKCPVEGKRFWERDRTISERGRALGNIMKDKRNAFGITRRASSVAKFIDHTAGMNMKRD